MELNDVISYDDVDYVILDKIEYLNSEYVYTVEIDKEEVPTMEYKYFKIDKDNDDYYALEIKDEELLNTITEIFKQKFIKENNVEQDG